MSAIKMHFISIWNCKRNVKGFVELLTLIIFNRTFTYTFFMVIIEKEKTDCILLFSIRCCSNCVDGTIRFMDLHLRFKLYHY